MDWMSIESAPRNTEILCSVTYSLGTKDDGSVEWQTDMWVDYQLDGIGWALYPSLIHIPCEPTHWQPLPEPPK